jgi:hypothetical protein
MVGINNNTRITSITRHIFRYEYDDGEHIESGRDAPDLGKGREEKGEQVEPRGKRPSRVDKRAGPVQRSRLSLSEYK